MKSLKLWIKRLLVAVLALVAVAVMIGTGYEAKMRRQAARDYPAPGRLIDIGGRKIQLDCRGSGSPIVVLEAGLDGNGSLAWAKVHDSIAVTTRACAYSRAGVMWSDDNPGHQSAVMIATDLKAALVAAGENAPYVMVGHSLGGPYIMTFTKLHEADVAGLVFVDASHPEQVQRFNFDHQQRSVDTTLLRAGRYDESLAAVTRVLDVDPHFGLAHLTLGWVYLLKGMRDQGLAELERAVSLAPESTMYRAQLGQALAQAGRTEEARDVLSRLEELSTTRYVSPYHLAYVYAGLGERERAMDLLEQAHEARAGGIFGVKGSFLFTSRAPMRGSRRCSGE